MASPLGSSDFATTAPGAVTGNDGSLSGMAARSQSAVTSQLQAQAQESSAWTNTSTTFFGTILGGFFSVVANVTAAIDDFLADLCLFITGATGGLIDLQSWATTLQANAGEALGNTQTISTGISGSSDPTTVAPAVGSINSNIVANSNAIASLTATQTAAGNGGVSLNTGFPAAGALSGYAGFGVGGSDLGAGVYLDVGAAGDLGIAGSPTAAGTLFFASATPLATDNHSVTLVCENQGSVAANSMLVVRARYDFSELVYANVFGAGGTAYLGYGGFDSGTGLWTFNDWTSQSISQNSGQAWTLTAEGETYTLSYNGMVVLSWTDTAGNASIGSAYRTPGGGIAANSVPVLGYQFGWQVSSFSAVDISSPPVVGVGWELERLSTSAGTSFGSTTGWQTLPTGTFDTSDFVNGCTVNGNATGAVTITIAGWYSLSFAAEFSSAGGMTGVAAGVYWIPASGTARYLGAGNALSSTASAAATTSITKYLNAGDQIAPALYMPESNTLVGGGNYSTRFSGATWSPASAAA